MYAQEMEGFMPLRKAMSEPVAQGSGHLYQIRRVPVYKGPDYYGAKLTGLSARLEIDNETKEWKPVARMASFTKQAPETIEEESSTSNADDPPKAVLVVDPFSTGALLATRALRRGFRVIRVLSDADMIESPNWLRMQVADGICVDYEATIVVSGTAAAAYDAAARALSALPYTLVAIIAGAETGVLATDELATRLGLRGNGNDTRLSKARRNKYLMGEVVRATGVRAVAQRMVKTWEDAREFLEKLQLDGIACRASTSIYPVVVKPVESAGSDDVFKCQTTEDVKQAVERIAGKVNGLGVVNECALVQEFLQGNEYVVDSVSRNGVQKVISIWKYDKRAINGANFVYHGMSMVDVNGGDEEERKVAKLLVEYSKDVLKALSITNGPSHMEIMVSDGSACLVEVGARCHGGEGSWSPIATACLGGYDQIDATLMAYLDPSSFDALPETPPPLVNFGSEIFFVTRVAGMVRSMDSATKFIQNLPSFKKIEWQLKPGDYAALTVDCFTRPGSAQLVHSDPGQVRQDYDKIRTLETSSIPGIPPLLDLEFVCRVPIDKGTVVVVDPYSSGAILAARVRSVYRKKLVVVHSDPNSPVAALVASGTNVKPHAVIMHHGDPDKTAEQIVKQARAVIACIPGAETGVLLADQLADRLGTRVNSMHLSKARRNKFLQGEVVRAADVRAVEQTKASTWQEAKSFLDKLTERVVRSAARVRSTDSIYPIIVKPVESAGSDDVYKCLGAEDVKKAVELITGKINGLGNMNDGALVQEFLKGEEYVVDGVSRDGVHKVVAVWKYDKRSANGSNFVYFGMSLISFFGDEKDAEIARSLAAYSIEVLNALHIRDGPSHMEIKFDPDTRQPCLVEVGARCHGGEGTWLPIVDACIGYNQVDATLDCFIDADAFDILPNVPGQFKNYGREVFLVSRQHGTVKKTNVEKLRSLKSFAKLELSVQPGSQLVPTVDCFTRPGSVQLIHSDPSVVQADYEAIRDMEKGCKLFSLE